MASTSKLPNGSDSVSTATAGQPIEASWSIGLPLSDALPYFDDELDTKPGLASRVQKEVQAEMAKMNMDTQDSRLPPTSLYASSAYDEEMQRIALRQEATKAIDMTRFQLAPPAAGLEADDEEWKKAVDNAAAQLMHQETRMTNIELLKKFGANQWRLHNYQQEHLSHRYEDARETQSNRTMRLNRSRRSEQTDAGKKLAALEARWTELISRGLQLEVANIAAEHEVAGLRAEEEALRRELERME